MGERSARSSSNGGTTNLNATGLRRIGFAAMSLACPLMLASLSVANAVAQSPEDRLTEIIQHSPINWRKSSCVKTHTFCKAGSHEHGVEREFRWMSNLNVSNPRSGQ